MSRPASGCFPVNLGQKRTRDKFRTSFPSPVMHMAAAPHPFTITDDTENLEKVLNILLACLAKKASAASGAAAACFNALFPESEGECAPCGAAGVALAKACQVLRALGAVSSHVKALWMATTGTTEQIKAVFTDYVRYCSQRTSDRIGRTSRRSRSCSTKSLLDT